MLDKEIIERLREIFADIGSSIELLMLAAPSQPGADEMRSFLSDFVSSSPKLTLKVEEAVVEAPTFGIIKEDTPTGVRFCGIPNGHEFSTLILAVLNADGRGRNLPDEGLAARIRALNGPVDLRTFVSLTCTNCPDVAQALNVVALLNPAITNTVIDGGVVGQTVAKLGIQSVPAVYVGDRLLSVGRASLADLLAKLEQLTGTSGGAGDEIVHEYQVVVLGGGPAGAAAAIYSARKGFKTAVVADTVGGQVKETSGIENLISVAETTGPALADSLRAHMSRYPIDIFENRTADSVDLDGRLKSVTCGNETFAAPSLIVATGAGWRRLGVPGEELHIGHGVAFCTHCDGPFYAGKRVAVVGGGNSGIEAAIDLAAICPVVDVFEFMDSLKADDVLQEKARACGNVNIHLSSQVTEVIGNSTAVSGLRVRDRISGAERVYPVEGVFVQIGLLPNSSLFAGKLRLTPLGEIEIDACCRTSVAGVYAAGDVTSVPYKQIVIAMGEGAKAALSAFDDTIRS